MKRFNVGRVHTGILSQVGPLDCDLSTLIDTRMLVQANSGGGKSWCLRRLLEQTHGAVQQLFS